MIEYHMLERCREAQKAIEEASKKGDKHAQETAERLEAGANFMLIALEFAKSKLGFKDTFQTMDESLLPLFNTKELRALFYNLNPNARQAVFQARNKALLLGEDYLGTEHLFWALTEISEALPRMGITPEIIETTLKKFPEIRDKVITERFSLSPSVIVVFGIAAVEANRLGWINIGTDLLIVGLTSVPDEKSVTAKLLEKIGVNREHLHKRILDNLPNQKR